MAEQTEMARAPRDAAAGAPADPVARARAGDGSAFDELYHTNVGRVYAICLRMTADRARAEELTQDVFVRAWDRIATFAGAAAFSTWLHRVTVNVVLDDMKRRRRSLRRFPPHAEPDLDDVAPPPSDPLERLTLEEAVAALPERARMALVLHSIEGYRYEEVAELMEISIGAVKSHIHRARALLMERLGGR